MEKKKKRKTNHCTSKPASSLCCIFVSILTLKPLFLKRLLAPQHRFGKTAPRYSHGQRHSVHHVLYGNETGEPREDPGQDLDVLYPGPRGLVLGPATVLGLEDQVVGNSGAVPAAQRAVLLAVFLRHARPLARRLRGSPVPVLQHAADHGRRAAGYPEGPNTHVLRGQDAVARLVLHSIHGDRFSLHYFETEMYL